MLRIMLVLFIAGEAVAQVDFTRPCPLLNTVKNFDLRRFMGEWYEARRYSSSNLENTCVTANYHLERDGSVTVKNFGVANYLNRKTKMTGTTRPNGAKWTVTFQLGLGVLTEPLWVLGTDYENYAVVWSCEYSYGLSTRNSQILTRKQHPPSKVLEDAYKVATSNGMERRDFRVMEQSNCPK